MADQAQIDRIVDAHPLNGRYGFDRDAVVQQLIMQARLTEAEAIASTVRGAGRMLVRQETVAVLARLAAAALAEPPSITEDRRDP